MRINSLKFLILPTTAVMFVASSLTFSVEAATVTIGANRDTTLFQNNPNNSLGLGQGIFAGNNGQNSPRRGLIGFDIAGNIPVGATITGAQLTLFLGQVAGAGGGGGGDATPRNISLFRVNDSWNEGTAGVAGQPIAGSGQGNPANPGDATWNFRSFNTLPWGTPGGDFSSTPSATATVGQTLNTGYTWSSTAALVSDVQSWLNNPSANFGWLLQGDESAATTFRAFYSREASPALVPQLLVTYETSSATPVPEPSGIAGVIGLVIGTGVIKIKRKSLK